MCLDPNFRKQTGAGLPVALFIITVLALLVVGMAQLQESSGRSISLQIQSQRAFFAAESGGQVGVNRVLADPTNPQCFANDTLNFSNAGLSGCRAVIRCTDITGNGLFEVISEGRCGTGQEAASRTVEVRLR
ncbi:MAG: MSHA bioproteinis protein MshP [Marinobacter sp. T13-3]|nr:MAG: MSHA bioproteinis protein MshP [Marinobacter sp. T13-3]